MREESMEMTDTLPRHSSVVVAFWRVSSVVPSIVGK
jgi:hypothetical protein